MSQPRRYIAFSIAGVISLLVLGTIAWTINSYDWGVALMLLAPFVIYGLIRLARALEAWAGD